MVDKHFRRLSGTFLAPEDILKIEKNYERKKIEYPKSGLLDEYKNADAYDITIAIWTDYFNKKLAVVEKLDPNVVKALIASESDFLIDPKNPKAIGIAQITRETLKIVQDPNGETKEFIFKDILQKDLKNPGVAIPIAVRWIFRKKATAEAKLKRTASSDEIILEYKGLLKSKSEYKNNALKKFRKIYGKLNSE